MKFTTEYIDQSHEVLIITPVYNELIGGLKRRFESLGSRVHILDKAPSTVSSAIRMVIFFRQDKHHHVFVPAHHGEIQQVHIVAQIPKKNLIGKTILMPDGDYDIDPTLEKIMYFMLRDNGASLELTPLPQKAAPTAIPLTPKQKVDRIFHDGLNNPRRIILLILAILLLLHLAYIPIGAAAAISRSQGLYELSRSVYAPVRPTWLLFGLARYPDALFATGDSAREARAIQGEVQTLLPEYINHLMAPSQGVGDESSEHLKNTLKTRLARSIELATILSQTPTWIPESQTIRTQASTYLPLLKTASSLMELSDKIIPPKGEKLYAIFFANSNEMRPGGGFIGSFALVYIRDGHVSEWKMYDVYDADGQLTARIPPPVAISRYLNQPFFFLRDSNFSPDTKENMKTAEMFLQRELGIRGIDGGAVVTLAAVEKLLHELGPVSLPDYGVTVHESNFALLAQDETENEFFPGSIQKKKFLESLLNRMITLAHEPANGKKFARGILKGLDTKLITAYSTDTDVQKAIEKLYWAGRIIPPLCAQQRNCVLSYTYPVEANVGVNKANALVSRRYSLSVDVASDGAVSESFETFFTNDSYPQLFPGGVYRNYYQIYLPNSAQNIQVAINGKKTDAYEIEQNDFTQIRLYISIPEQSKMNVKVSWKLREKLSSEKNTLELIIPKQVGMPSSDLNLRLHNNFGEIMRSNIPLVTGSQIEYNSSLNSDKFYYFTFKK